MLAPGATKFMEIHIGPGGRRVRAAGRRGGRANGRQMRNQDGSRAGPDCLRMQTIRPAWRHQLRPAQAGPADNSFDLTLLARRETPRLAGTLPPPQPAGPLFKLNSLTRRRSGAFVWPAGPSGSGARRARMWPAQHLRRAQLTAERQHAKTLPSRARTYARPCAPMRPSAACLKQYQVVVGAAATL